MASALPGALRNLLGVADSIPGLQAAPVSWKNRLKEAAYTSPSGSRIKFTYESVSRETEKRDAAFEFPGVEGAYIQHNGHGARRYPLRCIFWGDNCDLIATAFEAAVLEAGVGKLEHPFYGTFDVVPFGTITRRDDLKDAANQTIVEVVFWSTLGAVYPSTLGSPRNEILAALDGFDVAAANQFSNAVNLASVVSKANVIDTVRDLLGKVSGTLSDVAAVNAAVARDFRDLQSTVNFGLDVLIGQPLLLAQQISSLVKAPARALAGIQSRLEAYQRLAESIVESRAGSGESDLTPLARLVLRLSNDFHTADLFAMNAVGGSALSVVEHQFASKPEALSAAEALLAQLDAVVEWREARFGGLGQVDPGGSYQALQATVASVAAYLVQISFTLVPERRIVLDRSRTIVDLAAELYGSVDDRIDFLIESNGLTGSEILELPRGRAIVYYP